MYFLTQCQIIIWNLYVWKWISFLSTVQTIGCYQQIRRSPELPTIPQPTHTVSSGPRSIPHYYQSTHSRDVHVAPFFKRSQPKIGGGMGGGCWDQQQKIWGFNKKKSGVGEGAEVHPPLSFWNYNLVIENKLFLAQFIIFAPLTKCKKIYLPLWYSFLSMIEKYLSLVPDQFLLGNRNRSYSFHQKIIFNFFLFLYISQIEWLARTNFKHRPLHRNIPQPKKHKVQCRPIQSGYVLYSLYSLLKDGIIHW